jgi:aminomethyltransferase
MPWLGVSFAKPAWEERAVSQGTETSQGEQAAGEERRTPLYDRHVALGARMVPFAGWSMPVQYTGILDEHRAVREAAGLFDLGHMGEVDVHGPDAVPFLQYITTNDVSMLRSGEAQYSLLPNERGGVVDDIIIYRRPTAEPTDFMVVINAANHDKDVSWIEAQRDRRLDLEVNVNDISLQTGMVAIQGPHAEQIVQPLTEVDLSTIQYFTWIQGAVAGVPAMIARTGYTGEDGFEFYTAIGDIATVWDALMAEGADKGLVPVGLGARDSLRLEARMPLYGNELADDINPLEAGLGWAVKLDKGEFIGRPAIAAMKESGVPRRTVGFELTQRSGAPRTHYEVQVDDRPVGYVTSGMMSPTLGCNIGLALVDRDVAGVGKPLDVIIRGKPVRGIQRKMPFYRRAK